MTTRDKRDDQSDRPREWRVEGVPEEEESRSRLSFSNLPGGSRFWLLVLAMLAINWFLFSQFTSPPERLALSYTTFVQQVEAENVAEVVSTGETIQGTLESPITDPSPPEDASDPNQTFDRFETERPTFAEDDLLALLAANDVEVNAEPADAPAPLWQQLVFGFGPTLLLLWIIFSVFRRASAGMSGGMAGLGRSQAKRYDEANTTRVSFDDVAGIEDAEEELVEIVDFLRNPDKYTRLGGAIPKGVLLTGPPGTGKTLLARAVAGEADVPFFSMSASEFIEMVVGVGASRVRDLFEQAKNVAPAIIFIDELDAIGRSRGGSMSLGGHDEREQTLNQILTEMDGFTGSEGVIVIAATNRPEILDQALLRPGRFDRQVAVSPPDQRGRAAIIKVHTRGKPVAPDVDIEALASSTPGMVGADLRNLINEAALMAARRNHEGITMSDFTDALEKVILGTERRIMMSEDERRRTAYHEAGHALLGMLQPGADPVRKISIIPRGRALGVTFQSPDADKYSYGEEYLKGRIIGMLGGRAAEEIVFDAISTGAENDMVKATGLVRAMVGKWGMSDVIGPVAVFDEQSTDAFGRPQVSEHTMQLVDEEIRTISDECYHEALRMIKEHRDKLEALAQALLDKETLEEDEAYNAAGIDRDESTGGFPPSV